LPIVLDDVVSGAIVLSANHARPVGDEERLLWRAMATQVCTALDSARMFARLQDALRARSEFVNTMSHELRSPLHVILGYSEMLRRRPRRAAGRRRPHPRQRPRVAAVGREHAHRGAPRWRPPGVQPSEFDLQPLFDELRESVAALPEAGTTATVAVADRLAICRGCGSIGSR
jgi:signal transduction histidine kinase